MLATTRLPGTERRRYARPGRPCCLMSPADRAKHVAVAHALLIGGRSAVQVARDFGCARQSVYNWRDLALIYPEGAYLRRLKSA